jgi:hypothetical protein
MCMALMLLLAAGAGREQSNSHQGSAQQEAARKFRTFLEQDGKQWMEEYPETAS